MAVGFGHKNMGEAVAIGSPTGIYSAEIIKNIKKYFKSVNVLILNSSTTHH